MILRHDTFTAVTRDRFGVPTFELERVGRSQLGIFVWRLLADLREPLNQVERIWWAKFVKSNPRAAIRAYARFRRDRDEDVDVESALGLLDQAERAEGAPS